MSSRMSPQARLFFKDAFDSLEQIINASDSEDARILQSTTLQDVYDAARKLEQELGALHWFKGKPGADLAVFVYDNYIRPGHTSSILQPKKLIPTLLSSIPSVRIIIDGLLGEIRLNFGAVIGDGAMVGIERDLLEKAEGMFLWVRLVLRALERVCSIQQLNDVVRDLPKGLETVHETMAHFKRQIVVQDCGNAVRVLEWVAMAKRRLKKFELLDGISLHEGNGLLNEDTRLWESVIDICKPLIEEGPGGTIVFVNFTVREYLLRASKNALVEPIRAHHNISLACIAYLRTSFNFVDPQFPAEQKNTNVVKGFHGLHLYVNEYWLMRFILEFIQTTVGFRMSLKNKQRNSGEGKFHCFLSSVALILGECWTANAEDAE
ncbi:hypothetical protein AOQ84DRAFT_382837 [Glonium stellatum]|uniref:Uncharacterized protein n=1 Tax=Glonium stellatum TaxID=574774 RepID=A0A8E2EPA1_9PEZI|nr:hypothetical protein AOQ84DRAFT_382837 [Glonium stellatum]